MVSLLTVPAPQEKRFWRDDDPYLYDDSTEHVFEEPEFEQISAIIEDDEGEVDRATVRRKRGKERGNGEQEGQNGNNHRG